MLHQGFFLFIRLITFNRLNLQMTEDSNSELNFLKNRIAELELENALLKKGISRIGANSKTVTVPKEVQHIFDQAEKNVRKYFTGIEIDPPSASIQVDD